MSETNDISRVHFYRLIRYYIYFDKRETLWKTGETSNYHPYKKVASNVKKTHA